MTPIGDGVSESRIGHDPAYRIHFTQTGEIIVLLICGGDQSSRPGTFDRQRSWRNAGENTPWSAAGFLASPERIAAYLDVVFDDGDPATIAAALGDVARAEGMSQVAKDTRRAQEALYRDLSDKGNPHLATIPDILESFGLKLP